jgi:hypothetical protein
MNITDLTGEMGRAYALEFGTEFSVPEDIDLIPRMMQEIADRRTYGQPCSTIRLGSTAWECALWNSVTVDSDPIRAYLRLQMPSSVLLCGMTATLDPTLPPTCFEIS